jgi:hypothetical protein
MSVTETEKKINRLYCGAVDVLQQLDRTWVLAVMLSFIHHSSLLFNSSFSPDTSGSPFHCDIFHNSAFAVPTAFSLTAYPPEQLPSFIILLSRFDKSAQSAYKIRALFL